MHATFWALIIAAMAGCSGLGGPPTVNEAGGLPEPMHLPTTPLIGYASPCTMDGWSPSGEGICSRMFPPPLIEGAFYQSTPAIAFDPGDPERMVVVVGRVADDLGYVPDEPVAVVPGQHVEAEAFITADGGRTWSQVVIPAPELFWGPHVDVDSHAVRPAAFIDSTGRIHVFLAMAGLPPRAGPTPSPAGGLLHAWSDDGAAWEGGPMPHTNGSVSNVALVWEERGVLLAVVQPTFGRAQGSMWATPLGTTDWRFVPGFACEVATEEFDRFARPDMLSFGDHRVICPNDAVVYEIQANLTAVPVDERERAICWGSWLARLGDGQISVGTADPYGPCRTAGVLVSPVPGVIVPVQQFIGRPGDDAPPPVYSVMPDGSGNVVLLTSPRSGLPGTDYRPWLTGVAATGQVVFSLALVGDAEYSEDPAAAGPLEMGRCGVSHGASLVMVACTEHTPGSLRMFRVELRY